MSLIHSATVRNTLTNAVVDAIDGGSGPGLLVLMTSGNTPVATLVFANPAFGDSSGGIATANAISPDTNAAGGTVAKFKVTTSASTTIFEGSVGTIGSGEDFELSSLVIGLGDTVAVSTLTYTAPV